MTQLLEPTRRQRSDDRGLDAEPETRASERMPNDCEFTSDLASAVHLRVLRLCGEFNRNADLRHFSRFEFPSSKRPDR